MKIKTNSDNIKVQYYEMVKVFKYEYLVAPNHFGLEFYVKIIIL
jgi:hypothetical protein